MSLNRAIGLVILGTIVLYPFYYKIVKKSFMRRNAVNKAVLAHKNGQCVTATRTKIRFSRGDLRASVGSMARDDSYRTTYVYEIDGVTYKKKLFFSGLNPETPPYTLVFYYLPGKPKDVFTADLAAYNRQRQPGCLTMLLLPLLFILAVSKIVQLLLAV